MIRVDVYEAVFSNKNINPASALVASFKEYKTNNSFWSFGRDEPYIDPPSVIECGIKHVHIISRSVFQEANRLNKRLYDRTSDKHLVYAVSPYDPEHYLLIAIFNPEAHDTARNMSLMRDLVRICNEHFG